MESRSGYYMILFLVTGFLIVACGVILSLKNYKDISVVALSIGSSILAVVIVNRLWEISGGEPIRRSLNTLEQTSKIISDAVETGVRRIYHNRRAVHYETQNERLKNANDIFILSLVMKVAQSIDLRNSLLKCVLNGGRVRVLLSDPHVDKRTNSFSPSPLILRQHAEKDLEIKRMPASIKDSIAFLKDIKEEINSKNPELKDAFNFKIVCDHVIYCQITGIDEIMYVTHYCNSRQGLGSPTIRIEKTGNIRSLYQRHLEEFEYLWKKSREIPEGS